MLWLELHMPKKMWNKEINQVHNIAFLFPSIVQLSLVMKMTQDNNHDKLFQ
jgi:hypothetical protein